MSRRIPSTVITTLTAAILAAVATPALPQAKPVSLRYASSAPPKTPWVAQIGRFAQAVEEESKGTLKIEAFISSQLGNEQDAVQQVARGRIDMGGFATGAAAIVAPEMAALIMPFYFRSVAESDCTVDALQQPIADLFAKRGVVLFGNSDVGTIDLVGKKPFVVPADVKGIKAGSYGSKMYTVMWNALGANSSPLGVTEWAPSFQTGALDAVGTPSTFYVPSGLNKVAPVLSRVELWSSPSFTIMNKGVFDKLSKDHQDALRRAAGRETAAMARKEARAFETMIRSLHEKAGGQVANVTPAQRDEWRRALAPSWPQMIKEIGGESESFFRQIETARKGCEGRS
ncbi:MAG: TRAP transporter substrate-binding protein [Burkholderiales bacterium]|nr:TRAP transporter substrate-binding protein [Burkholderiales bacterium]